MPGSFLNFYFLPDQNRVLYSVNPNRFINNSTKQHLFSIH